MTQASLSIADSIADSTARSSARSSARSMAGSIARSIVAVPLLALAACGLVEPQRALPTALELAASCPQLTAASVAAALPVAKTRITGATLLAATSTVPEHCQIDGDINRRIGIDGQTYAIRFRVRLPTATWSGRFMMGGGGGTNGVLVDPVARLSEGYATAGTDGGQAIALQRHRRHQRCRQFQLSGLTAWPAVRRRFRPAARTPTRRLRRQLRQAARSAGRGWRAR